MSLYQPDKTICLVKLEADSWCGTPPSTWELTKLKYLFKERKDDSLGVFPPGAISFGEVIEKDMHNADTLGSYQDVHVGDFLVNPINLNYDLKSLRVAHSGINVRVSPAYIVLQSTSNNDARYLRWLMYQFDVAHMKTLGAGVRQTITYSDMGPCQVYLPPLHEQERIANFLDEQTTRIDALIAEKERLASSLQDIEEVTAFDLVTRGLVAAASVTSFSEPWLKEVPAHWGLSKLRHLAFIGNGSTPKRDNEAYWEDGNIPWLNSGAVNATRIVDASDYVTEVALKECHLPMVRPGSTVVALTGQGKTRGTASLTEIESTINQHLAYVSLFDGRMSDEYLWVALTGLYSVLRHVSDGEGSTKGALTCEQLNQLRLPVPPVGEQDAIVGAYVERTQAIEALRAHVGEHVSRLREYRSSLISAAVTGQLDISAYKASA
ncbi:MAG: restriction endonuclease subunit S [Rhodocyclaceae bacterium]|nr:restriction endonuclease subunit S [Rhodocyclaceae bacterium]